MKCWKCEHEVAEGINYCGNCGAPVNQKVHLTRWPLTKKRLLVLLIAAVMILGGMALGGVFETDPLKQELPAPTAAEKTDWVSILRKEIYTEDSDLSRAMEEAVKMKLVSENHSGITIEVTAPDVSDKALEWFQSVSESEYSDAALEEVLLELMNGETYTASFLLPFDAHGKPYITGEFLDAASCGTRTFYSALTAMLIEEMEESVNE